MIILKGLFQLCAWCRHEILPSGKRGRSLNGHEIRVLEGRISHGICNECKELTQKYVEKCRGRKKGKTV